jgi:hypothetical protein
MAMVRDLKVALLTDSQVEVREMASSAISVMVRICGEELVLKLRSVFLDWAREELLGRPKRRGVRAPKEEADSKEQKQAAAAAMQKRHAGVSPTVRAWRVSVSFSCAWCGT